jgi:capsular exopolysaccharide synthesis family protein
VSKFLKALDQAERDRALATRGEEAAQASPAPPASPPAPPLRTVRPADEPVPIEGVVHELVSLLAPASFEAEQYRTLRYIVEQAHRTSNVRIIAVSASAAGDGKTTTALNLAGALAQAPDAKVLVIDADLRHPAVATSLALGQADLPGLVDLTLDPTLTLAHVVRHLAPFNLSVVTAGRASALPYELLKSPALAQVLDRARREYDYVIVDTPPLVALPDCRLLAKHVDAFLLVVTAHRTPRRLFEAALAALDRERILGVVFNGDDDSPVVQYGRDPRHGYGLDSVPGLRRLDGLAFKRNSEPPAA